MKLKDFVRYWMPLLLYSGLIFYLSSMSQPVHPGLVAEFSLWDKVVHVFEYFILSFFVLRVLRFYKVKKCYLYAVIIAVLYGVTDEVHQLFVPGRLFSVWDMAANAVGALLIIIRKYFIRNSP